MWLVGALIYLPSTEDKLAAAAKTKLAEAGHGGVFSSVKATFSGQEATLEGYVATEAEKLQAGKLIADEIHLPGWFTSAMNPVIAVHNDIVVNPERAPFRPRPWLIVTLFGDDWRVDGVLPSADQKQDLTSAMATKLPPRATKLNDQIAISQTALPAANWDATLAGVPDLTSTPKEQSAIAVTACDGNWSSFPATATNAEIAAVLKAGKVSDIDITHALVKVRAWKYLTPEELKQQADQKAAAEAAAKAKADAKTPAAPNPSLGPFRGPNGNLPQ